MKTVRLTFVLTSLFLLASCGGTSSSSKEQGTGGQTNVTSSYDPFADISIPEPSSMDASGGENGGESYHTVLSIQIGGDISTIPDRYWNPEAAFESQCFTVSEEDHNQYDYTISLKKGDTILFFFDYSWDKIIDYKDVDWDYVPNLGAVDSYVSSGTPEEALSKKVTGIHILKDGTFTFSYLALGVGLYGMKSGMYLAELK